MTVSVIVPVYNGQNYIAEALASIAAQTHPPHQVLVVNDGSTDGTAELLRGYEVLHTPRVGPAAARNRGLANAIGDLVAFLDADDLWCSGHLERAVACLRQQPETVIVQGHIQRQRLGSQGFRNESRPYYFVNLGSLVVRRPAFGRVGMLDENLWENEDTDWMLRAWEVGLSKTVLPQVSLYYRMHQSNMVHSQRLVAGGVTTLVRRHLHRLRASGQTSEASPDRPFWDVYRGGPS